MGVGREIGLTGVLVGFIGYGMEHGESGNEVCANCQFCSEEGGWCTKHNKAMGLSDWCTEWVWDCIEGADDPVPH